MAGMEAGDDAGAVLDHIIAQFNTYEDYLDSQITTQDLFYLEVRLGRCQGASEHEQSALPRLCTSPPLKKKGSRYDKQRERAPLRARRAHPHLSRPATL